MRFKGFSNTRVPKSNQKIGNHQLFRLIPVTVKARMKYNLRPLTLPCPIKSKLNKNHVPFHNAVVVHTQMKRNPNHQGNMLVGRRKKDKFI